jgi:hypothetical protein
MIITLNQCELPGEGDIFAGLLAMSIKAAPCRTGIAAER